MFRKHNNPMAHLLLYRCDDSIYYEGLDKSDCMNTMRPSFMAHIEAGKPMNEFALIYREFECTEQDYQEYLDNREPPDLCYE